MNTLKLTLKQWKETPREYRYVIDGKKYVLTLDKETQATVLQPVEVAK